MSALPVPVEDKTFEFTKLKTTAIKRKDKSSQKLWVEAFYEYAALKGMLVFRYNQAHDKTVQEANKKAKKEQTARCEGICFAQSLNWIRQNLFHKDFLIPITLEVKGRNGVEDKTYNSIEASKWSLSLQKEYEDFQNKDSKLIASGDAIEYGKDAATKILANHGLRPAFVASNMKYDAKTKTFPKGGGDVAKAIYDALLKGLDPTDYGLIVLGSTVNPAGHQVACEFKTDKDGTCFRLFDPNFGEFILRDDEDTDELANMKKFLDHWIKELYAKSYEITWDLFSVYSIVKK
jgi:hypothetical protein